jgi:hypothetical protein
MAAEMSLEILVSWARVERNLKMGILIQSIEAESVVTGSLAHLRVAV